MRQLVTSSLLFPPSFIVFFPPYPLPTHPHLYTPYLSIHASLSPSLLMVPILLSFPPFSPSFLPSPPPPAERKTILGNSIWACLQFLHKNICHAISEIYLLIITPTELSCMLCNIIVTIFMLSISRKGLLAGIRYKSLGGWCSKDSGFYPSSVVPPLVSIVIPTRLLQ